MIDDPVAGFEYCIPTRLIFEHGGAAKLGGLLKRFGYKSAFLVIDPGFHAAGLDADLLRSLDESGIGYTIFTDVEPNPIDTSMERGADEFKGRRDDVVLGIGGGSAMDSAKAVAVLATNAGRLRDYDGNDRVPNDAWPLMLIPTTAGTGSEANYNLSVTNADTKEKMAVRSVRNCACVALLDPSLLKNLPEHVAAAAGYDALVHAVESYVSNRSTAPTRMIALEAVRRIAPALEPFVADRADSSSAGEMLYAASLAGMVISHTGTGAAHAVARALGGRYNVVHGVATGVLLEPVMRFNLEAAQRRYAEVGDALAVTTPAMDERQRAEAALRRIAAMRGNIGLPERLPITVDAKYERELAEWASRSAGPNPRKVSADDARRLMYEVVSHA
ncbi:MAG: iron-containing alcohol dehydrogenase [Vulcanimicrobiaceae bacterium]